MLNDDWEPIAKYNYEIPDRPIEIPTIRNSKKKIDPLVPKIRKVKEKKIKLKNEIGEDKRRRRTEKEILKRLVERKGEEEARLAAIIDKSTSKIKSIEEKIKISKKRIKINQQRRKEKIKRTKEKVKSVEEMNKRQLAYYADNRDERLNYQINYYKKNIKKISDYNKAYYLLNEKELRARQEARRKRFT